MHPVCRTDIGRRTFSGGAGGRRGWCRTNCNLRTDSPGHTDGLRPRSSFVCPFVLPDAMTGLTDLTMQTASSALNGLSLRAKVRADNIANSETPGFRARSVDFESALRAAGDEPAEAAYGTNFRDTPVDQRGNSVDLDTEVTELVSDNLMFQAMVNGFNYKANLLRTAIGN